MQDSGAGEGILVVVPSALTLGAAPGERSEGAFTLYNDGDGALSIDDIAASGEGFEVLDDAAFTLPPAAAMTLTVAFTAPETMGVYEGALTLTSDEEASTLALIGTAEVPALSASGVDFGEVTAGCSASSEALLESGGTGPLTLTDLSTSGEGFSVVAPALPLSLSPGEALAVEVGFAPTAEGARAGGLTVVADALGAAEVVLVGVGAAPPLEVLSWSLDELKPVDLVVAVDVSPGMSGYQVGVAEALTGLGDRLGDAGADWRALVVNDRDGCGVVISGEALGWGAEFARVMGTADAGRDLLARMAAAVDAEPCRSGWPRPAAAVHLLAVSNGDDTSGGDVSDWLPEGAVASAVAGPTPEGCEDAAPAWRYAEAADATGGALLSICERDDDARAEALFERSLAPLRTAFTVPGGLDEASLTVAVDGEPLASEWWSWDEESWTLSVAPERLTIGGELTASWSGVPDCGESR